MDALIGQSWESVVYLSSGGSPAALIVAGSVTLKFKKAGATSFQSRTPATSDWVELGFGFYMLKWAAADMSALGPFFFTLISGSFDNTVYDSFGVGPVPIPMLVPPSTCIVIGNIRDLGGNPSISSQIIVRGVDYPTRSGNSIISSDLIRTVPDAFGNFSLALLQGETVIIEVERAGIRNQIVIPAQPSAQLLDLLPPI